MASSGGSGNAGGMDDRARGRRRNQERPARRSSNIRITFVDSQDPNSRSTIQRHTAHHSNAQRRQARLEVLRRDRPRVLEWSRRANSADVLSVTSASSSASSSSISPLPIAQPTNPTADESTDTVDVPSRNSSQSSPERQSAIRYLTECLCQHSPNRPACAEIVSFALTDEACTYLLLGYCLSLRIHNGDSIDRDADNTLARNYLNRGTTLLRTRLSDSLMASADANIQAVLLLIAYTADFGSFDEVRIHANALRTMIDQRGREGDEEGYPSVIILQLRTIGLSRFFHLTLDCSEPCDGALRFPHGLFAI